MMVHIIIQLRAMQLYAHHAHNLCARVPFLQDHDFFGDVYSALESDYDGAIERQIGLHGEDNLDLSLILSNVLDIVQGLPTVDVKENKVFFMHLLELEKQLCQLIQEVVPSVSEGTKQMLGDICDRSEVRQYKMKQRLK